MRKTKASKGAVRNAVVPTHPIAPPNTAFSEAVERIRTGESTAEEGATSLMTQLTDEELLWLLDGDLEQGEGLRMMSERYNGRPIEAGRIDRLGIPGIRFADGPRGVVPGASTAFPVSLARAASWDADLERRVGDAIGAEARAQGANLFAGVCVNVPPFPGWGRSQEAYGEDPLLTGAMGAALTEGVRPWVMACMKHFALNSMEEARFSVDVRVDDATLHEAYLPHFRRGIEAGADAVMSAYNSVNGQWAGQNRALLTDVLRDTWGFKGFVMTDFVWGLRDPIGSVAAGQDLEMPVRQQRARELPAALDDGRLLRSSVLLAAQRLITAQLQLAVRALPDPDPTVVASPAHRSLAREAAQRGTVLLKNAEIDGVPVLPLQTTNDGTIAVLGRLADTANLGDHGSSRVWPPSTSTVLDGLRERFAERVVHVEDPEGSADAIAAADTVIVIVGMGADDEGEAVVAADPEAFAVFGGIFKRRWMQRLASIGMKRQMRSAKGGDRRDLHLPPQDVALIERVAALNPRTVVVMIGGSTLMPDPWDRSVAALLMAWYPGMEGGRAVADVLAGDAEPSGRLPLAIPRRRSDLPEADWKARVVRYPRWFGQQRLDRDGNEAAYALGFGLGYTSFALHGVTLTSSDGEDLTFQVTVTNTGTRRGRHVVQLYAWQTAENTLPRRALIGWACIELEAGERREVEVRGTTRPIQRWSGCKFAPAVGQWEIQAASFAGDPAAVTTSVLLSTAPA
ncbi:glycoside hydrolase family 3 C-terminal domain-containing protein [Streptomyces ardesiacus]|uniref:glycoside hydrolase family 3 protein n=1 Tax=Streptomyces ardesiacus TaxID=285564 RepID=UPI003F4A612A